MRRRVVLVTSLVVVVAGCAALYLLRFRRDTTTTAVAVEEAIDRFRELGTSPPSSTPAGTTAAPAVTRAPSHPPPPSQPASRILPAAGVYAYSTSGGDAIDALGGASHVYPSTSTITATAAGCGVSQRWVVAEERADEYVTCTTATGVELTAFTAFHRFLGQDEVEAWTCSGEARPVGAPAGTTWRAHCTLGDASSTWTGEVLGRGMIGVGGAEVAVEHVVVTIDEGIEGDHQRIETWYQQGTDLVVRRVVDNATTNPSLVGDVHYTEHYEISLVALTPAR